MATLTKTQIAHAQQRIMEAKQAYITKNTAHLGERPDVAQLTTDEKLALIRKGTATLRPTVTDNNRYYYVIDAFDYPVTKAIAASKAAADKWDAAAKVVHTKADKLESTLLDELIMSPDGAAALARIADVFA